REMIAVAVASEKLLAQLEENRARLAKLADPRTINLDDAEADRLVAQSTPVYYITGTIHSPETGAPTALMELAYRLAVDESPYVRNIRENLITLITPVVEVDGRDRMVDLYNWHLAHPGESYPPLIYWGHYVAHDNNRDAMGLTLNLTRNVLDTYTTWHAQVLHDLHESVPYLYDNTIGDGPYNAWLDPILTDEWQMIGWNNVSEMTKFGMPGVFAHGSFDTWSPGYLMFIAATHNGISRLYETFGNGGADTEVRTLSQSEYSRTWYRQNPPLPRARWSQRNNNNYEQTGLLTALQYFANNGKLFLKNFYLKSKRSIEKPKAEGPAAYVFPADDPRPGTQAELLRVLQLQGCEISRATAPFTVTLKSKRRANAPSAQTAPASAANANAASANPEIATQARPEGERREAGEQRNANHDVDRDATIPRGQLRRPHGSALQPHRRRAPRLSILESARPAAAALRRHRLDFRRAVQRAGRARHRPDRTSSFDGARRRAGARAGRRRGQRHGLRHQPQRGRRARDAPLPPEGREHRGRGRAFHSRGPQLQPRLLHHPRRRCRRTQPGRLRPRPAHNRAFGRALGEDASCQGRAHRTPPHMALDAGRGLVAHGLRQAANPIRLHQHAGGEPRCEPQREVRRDRLRARGPRPAGGRRRDADVGQPAPLEDDDAHAEHRQD
ncbi:MAG: hypothetical protein DMF66_01185, partial [Acidobacteria bacterium]